MGVDQYQGQSKRFFAYREHNGMMILDHGHGSAEAMMMKPDEPVGQSKANAWNGLSRRQILLTGVSVIGTYTLLGSIDPASADTSATPIYAIQQNGDMLFYKHAGADDGSPNWPIQAKQIGNGWNFRQVFVSK